MIAPFDRKRRALRARYEPAPDRKATFISDLRAVIAPPRQKLTFSTFFTVV